MSKLKAKEIGSSPFKAALLFVIIALVGFVGWYVYNSAKNTNTTYESAAVINSNSPPKFTKRPILGTNWGDYPKGYGTQKGYGTAKPTVIDNGGDGTGVVTNIKWKSWGGAKAIGQGTAIYVTPTQSFAEGTLKSATVVAFNLDTCKGKPSYNAVEWYFPQYGESFNPKSYIDDCAGSFIGS